MSSVFGWAGVIAPVNPPGWWWVRGDRPGHRWNAPWSAIGIRASAAVVMADLRDRARTVVAGHRPPHPLAGTSE